MRKNLTSIFESCSFLGLLTLLPACTDAGSPASFSVRDSAGVRIVESHQAEWDPDGGWRLSAEPILQIGEREGEESLQFFGVTGGARLSDGKIAILNNGTRTIRVYGPDGSFIREFGRDGEGPGEFRALSSVHVLPNDTLLLWDGRRRVFSLFTSPGEFVRSQRLTWVGSEALIGIRPLPDGRLVVKTYAGPGREELGSGTGIHRAVGPLLLFDREGVLLDTIGLFPNAESAIFELAGQPGYTVPPFDKNFFFDVWRESIILGTAERMEVLFWDVTGGPRALFRDLGSDLTVKQEDRDWYEEHFFPDAVTPEAQQERTMLLRDLMFPETRAAFTDLEVDPAGNIWLRTGRHIFYYAESREWTIFSSAGGLLGTISLPVGFKSLEFGSDEILGVWKDDLGVEFVRVYSIEKREPA